MTTPVQTKYWALQLALHGASGSLDQLSRSIANARVDLNPHQVEAALAAVRSPLSKGIILADEVGLGKTIEAGLVIAQRWAERRRRILIIVPATLRKQWAQELEDKFHIPTVILDTPTYNRALNSAHSNPFDTSGAVICSYQFAANKRQTLQAVTWDLAIIDEAHRLRNVYKSGNKIASALRDALSASPKVLLTATPLQNSLMELYGLTSFIDPYLFGDDKSFRDQFVRRDDDAARNTELRARLAPICHRTLRRQVLEYIRFTERRPRTWEFYPSDAEQRLYEAVSSYLQRDALYAIPNAQRKLITMVLRKLLASSTFAIASTLQTMTDRLERGVEKADAGEMGMDYAVYDETAEEWQEDTSDSPAAGTDLAAELEELRGYAEMAARIEHNEKGTVLLEALRAAFTEAAELGAGRKAVIFTESQRTQRYLFELLESHGYNGEVVLLNGTNTDPRSKAIYARWVEAHAQKGTATGSRAVDTKAAIVDAFRQEATILVATEAAAEGVNLQFCSLVVNYDLPWNPQRIEQRIGRCHRYGQKHDVVVVNFLNKNNAADQRVYELLEQKFRLFDGVFGASDEVLGALESGVDIERRIADIYQQCRSEVEITYGFDRLQQDLEQEITARMSDTRRAVLENFDEDVHRRLKLRDAEARARLDWRQELLWRLTRVELSSDATFDDNFCYLDYHGELAPKARYHLDWRQAENQGEAFFRPDHPLAETMMSRAIGRPLAPMELHFQYEAYGAPVAILAERLGQSGWLRATRVTVKSIEEEEHLLVAAIADSGLPAGVGADALDADWCDRLLNIPAKAAGATSVSGEVNGQLDELIAQQHAAKLEEIETRNGKYFEEEVDKLDRWAEDVKLTLERELKELDAEIRAARKDSKTKVVLAEKLEAQRRIKTLEQRRNGKRRQLFDAQDDVDKQRTQLIEDIERQLKTSAERETLFTIRWVLPEAPSN